MIVSFSLQEKWVCALRTPGVVVLSSDNDYREAFRKAINALIEFHAQEKPR